MKRVATVLAITCAVVGLAASVASAIDYLGADPTFCAETSCATVRASAWSHPLGIPLPVLGIAWNLAALALCFVARPRLRVVVALGGALGGAALIAIQAFAIGTWCKLCLVADPAAIGYGLAVALGAGTARRWWPALPGLAAAIAVLALWTRGPGGPDVVADRATIIEYVDFECPFCREMQQRLHAAIERAGVPVKIVRKMIALPQHAGAMPAAFAWCCANRQGKGEAMAEALFAADPKELTHAGCEKIAEKVGCDMERYHRDAPLAVGEVAVDMLAARGAGVHGLPTLVIGKESVVGASATVDDLVAMITRAAAR